MQDISFSCLENDHICRSTYHELFGNKRILFCSSSRPHVRLTQLYLKHLTRCKKKYKEYNIDNIVIVDSTDNTWNLPVVSTFHPALFPILDDKQELLSFFAKQCNKSEPIDFLKIYWRYQILVDN